MGIISQVLYELRPCPIPKRSDVERHSKALRDAIVKLGVLVRDGANQAKKVAVESPLLVLKFCLWLCAWWAFSYLEFGLVFLLVCLIAMLFSHLGDGSDSTWSAYSVFNKGCRSLLGSLNVAQFEREIMGVRGAPPQREGQGGEGEEREGGGRRRRRGRR
ncbi:unnamed protein product [Chrysoparadoxa australica]